MPGTSSATAAALADGVKFAWPAKGKVVAGFNVIRRQGHAELFLECRNIVGDVRDHDCQKHVAEIGIIERDRVGYLNLVAETLQ